MSDVTPGTGGAQAGDVDPAAVPKSTVTTADDLIVASGNAAVTRLGVGASRIVGKKAAGGLTALTAAETVAILVPSPVAITQTFATADATHAARTAAALTDNTAGTADTTVAALPDPADTPVTADSLRDDIVANLLPALRNDLADIIAQVNALRVDQLDTASLLNSVVDALQTPGILS